MFYSANGMSGWSEISKLVASGGKYHDGFGGSVSVWNNTIVVGASEGDSSVANAGNMILFI